MEEIVYIMTETARLYLIENLSKPGPIYDKIVFHFKNKDNPKTWLSKEIGTPAFQEVKKCMLPDLIASSINRGSTEVENAKLLYGSLDISRSFATDPRLWAGLACTKYFDFTVDNILLATSGEREINAKTILEHFVFSDSSTRAFEKNNTISRLWWIGDFFIRKENTANPFYLLDEVSQDINMYVSRCMTVKLFNNRKLLDVLISTIKKVEKEQTTKVSRDLISKCVAHLNYLGGMYSLDVATKEFLEIKLTEYLISILPKQSDAPELSNSAKIIVNTLSKCEAFTTWQDFCKILSDDKNIKNKAREKAKRILKKEISKETSEIIQTIKIEDEVYISLKHSLSDAEYKDKQYKFKCSVIASLKGDAKSLYNIISSIRKHTFKKEHIITFETHFKLIYGDTFDINSVIENGSKVLVDAGIISINGDTYTNKMIEAQD